MYLILIYEYMPMHKTNEYIDLLFYLTFTITRLDQQVDSIFLHKQISIYTHIYIHKYIHVYIQIYCFTSPLHLQGLISRLEGASDLDIYK
jgi:hypothetical protein